MKPKSKRTSFLPRSSQASEGADYRVPLLPVADIIGFFEQIDLILTEEDIVAPSRARIQLLFFVLIEIFLPWRLDSIQQKFDKAIALYENNEFGEDLCETFVIFEETRLFLEQIRYADFDIRDILAPTHHRIQKILSAIVNFALHRDNRWAFFSVLSNGANEIAKKSQELMDANEELEEFLREKREANEAEAPEIATYEERNQEDENKLRQLHKETDKVVKIGEEYKAERRDLKDTLQELNYSVLNVIEEVKAGKFRQALDYDTLVKEYNEIKTALDSMTEELSQVSNSIPQIDQLLTTYKGIDKHLSKCIQLINSSVTVRTDTARQQKTNTAIIQEIQTLDTTSARKAQTQLSNLKKVAETYESRKRNLLEKKKITKQREDDYWNHYNEETAAYDKDIKEAEAEKEEFINKITKVKVQIDALQYHNEMETKKMIRTIFEDLCKTALESIYKQSEERP